MSNNDTAEAAINPADEPKVDPVRHAPEAEAEKVAPEAEAGISEETDPELTHDSDPESVPPPELSAGVVAEVAAPAVGSGFEADAAKAKKAKSKTKAAPEPGAVEELTAGDVPPEAEPVAEAKPENKKKWYAVKVQSGREDTIRAAILRKVAIEGLEEFFGDIAVPFEEVIEKKPVRVKNKKTGEYEYQEKKVTKRKKKFHGYIFANVEFNDRILYLFRETSGVGDFLNVRGTPGNPIAEPMPDHEVTAMLTGVAQKDPNKKVKIKLDFEKGDKVRIRDGSFANQEGEVKAITDAKDPNEAPKVTVLLTFWGRPLDVEVEANQVEKL